MQDTDLKQLRELVTGQPANSKIRLISKMSIVIIAVIILLAVSLYLLIATDTIKNNLEEKDFQGYRSHAPGEGLSLEQAAQNLKYFGSMSSVCHSSGKPHVQAGYSYLFNQTNRYIHSGKWPFKRVMDAIQASRKTYLDIDTALACSAATDNFHGLDLDQDLRLMTLALNHRFYKDKVPACKKAENLVDTRIYGRLAEEEHRKLYSSRYTAKQITRATDMARTSPDRQKIHGC